MKRHEHTSARVAKIAGRILAHKAERYSNMALLPLRQAQIHLSWSDIRALAASCLTQVEPVAPKKGKRRCAHEFPKFAPFKRKVHKPFTRGKTMDENLREIALRIDRNKKK